MECAGKHAADGKRGKTRNEKKAQQNLQAVENVRKQICKRTSWNQSRQHDYKDLFQNAESEHSSFSAAVSFSFSMQDKHREMLFFTFSHDSGLKDISTSSILQKFSCV